MSRVVKIEDRGGVQVTVDLDNPFDQHVYGWAIRRHLRRERVAEARKAGKTLREIAKTEGVAETTVINDLDSVWEPGTSWEVQGQHVAPVRMAQWYGMRRAHDLEEFERLIQVTSEVLGVSLYKARHIIGGVGGFGRVVLPDKLLEVLDNELEGVVLTPEDALGYQGHRVLLNHRI